MSAPQDVAVVGGGPAGSAAALGAAHAGARVVLFEPRPMPMDKPCGEGLMACGVDALARLVGEDVRERLAPFAALRWVVGGRRLDLPLPRPGGALPRPRLMEELDQALERAGIERRPHAARVERATGGFEVHAGGEVLPTRTVVAADGAGGSTCAWLRRRGPHGGRRGARARFENATDLASVEVHLGGTLEVYLTPLPGGVLNVAVLGNPEPGMGARTLLERALDEHPAARARLGKRLTESASVALRGAGPATVAADGAFLAGDAAGAVDPVLGCGTTLALRGGLAAGSAAAETAFGGDPRRIARSYGRLIRKDLRGRRLLAGGLLSLSRRPLLLGGVVTLGKVVPAAFRPLLALASEGRAFGRPVA